MARDDRFRFALALTFLFSLILAFTAFHHELWRDEMQAWLMARDIPTLQGLVWQMHYEGTPPLWFLCLRGLAHLTHRPEIMQVFTWGLSCGLMFLLCFFAPFHRWHKILFILNYYLLYQYGTLSRNYLLSLLALAGACALFPSAKKQPFLFAALLFLASFSSIHGWILAAAMGIAFWTSHRHPPSLLIFLAGLCFSIFLIIPAPDALFPSAAGWHLHWNPERCLQVAAAISRSYLMIPNPRSFWETVWWDPLSNAHWLAPTLACLLILAAIRTLYSHREALLFFLIGTFGLSLFFYVKYIGYSRHIGFYFFCFLYALWLKKASEKDPMAHSKVGDILLAGFLIIQAAGGAIAAAQDIQHPFSFGKAAARDIEARHLENSFIAAGPDYLGATLSGYLNRSLYYPQGNRKGSFTRWDFQRIEMFDDEEFLRRTEAASDRQAIIVAVGRPFPDTLLKAHGYAPIRSFEGSLVGDEDYYLYLRPSSLPRN